jgi:sodium/potassium-transporting ATPase subunit alpha
MAKHSVLVKNLATIETLGCMSVLCSDKTGTLTVGHMVRLHTSSFHHSPDILYQSVQDVAFHDQCFTVDHIAENFSADDSSPAPKALKSLHMVARLCNEASFDDSSDSASNEKIGSNEKRPIKGNATDAAILRFADPLALPSLGVNSDTLLASHTKLFEIPFNSRNKWMLSVVRAKGVDDHDPWMLVKGAPDVLFPHCTSVLNADGTAVILDTAVQIRLNALQAEWSSQGQRVLALCKRILPAVKIDPTTMSSNDMEELMYAELRDLTLVGLIGIRDPPRYDVKEAISIIRRAGVRVFMVTGDFKLTALAIARQVCREPSITIIIVDILPGQSCHSRKD